MQTKGLIAVRCLFKYNMFSKVNSYKSAVWVGFVLSLVCMHLRIYFIITLWNFLTSSIYIEQRITNVNDFRRHLHCPVLHFTIHSVLINRNTVDFAIKFNCFVASKMVFCYTSNFLMPALRAPPIELPPPWLISP